MAEVYFFDDRWMYSTDNSQLLPLPGQIKSRDEALEAAKQVRLEGGKADGQ